MLESPGRRLALLRSSMGYSQRVFAASVGVSPATIGMIESDKAPPSRNFLQKMSDAYNVNADWLLYGRGEMQHPPEPGFRPSEDDGQRVRPPLQSKSEQGDFASDGTELFLDPPLRRQRLGRIWYARRKRRH